MYTRMIGVVCAAVIGFVSIGEAALLDRGGGFIYDDVLDITWTQSADLSGAQTWDNAVAWADGLSLFDTVRNVTWDDWRLASMSVASGLPTGSASSVVDCRTATEMACRDNELGYMFYRNLEGNFLQNLTGTQMTNDGVEIQNIAGIYWSGTEYALDTLGAWNFSYSNGNQGPLAKRYEVFAWAVRDGDVAPVPVPSAMPLMGFGLIGLVGWHWRKNGSLLVQGFKAKKREMGK